MQDSRKFFVCQGGRGVLFDLFCGYEISGLSLRRGRGLSFFDPPYVFLNFIFIPFDALAPAGRFAGIAFLLGAVCYPFYVFLNFYFFLRRAQATRGPLLSAPAESRQRQAQGSFTPLRIPGPKWGAGRPPLETPKSSLARQTWPNSSPLARLELRCRWGRPRARARSPRLPHLHRFGMGASPPCPPRSPLGNVCRSCTFGGLTPPCPPRSPFGDVCRSCAPAHGTASETACGQRLRKSPGSSCRASG